MSYAQTRGRFVLPSLLLLVAIIAVFGGAVAQPDAEAQESAGVVVAKTEGVGQAGEPPVAGATFRLTRLPELEVADEGELNALARSNPRLLTEEPGTPVGDAFTAVTGDDGLATFGAIEPGVYQLIEVPSFVGESRPSAASPSLIVVHAGEKKLVRGKNQPLVVNKEALSTSVRPGQKVSYRVESNVPDVDARGKLYRYEFLDELDEAFSTGAINSVVVTTMDETFRLEPGEHFTESSTDRQLSFDLNDAGLEAVAQLRAGHPETRVEVELYGVLRQGLDDGKKVLNRAAVSFDGMSAFHRVLSQLVTVVIDSSASSQPSVPPNEDAEEPKPSVPGKPSFEGGPGKSPGSDSSKQPAPAEKGGEQVGDRTFPGGILASTGASILGLVLAASCLLLAGIIVLRRRRESDESSAESSQVENNRSQ